ncbi:MAG: decaprenyl-phosphate phosphoribosyltransferase [Sedimentisphaerales bacterium]|nr:decaprenyl-phosphate phosphoribosyltransferase [Sedimentisphaerales bacterium]
MKYLQMMRPLHWMKNVFVFAALIFGRKLFGPIDEVLVSVSSAVGAFFCFCMASSSTYIFNDIIDRDTDRLHPENRKRPLAAGLVSVGPAVVLAIVCASSAIIGAFILARALGVIIVVYIVMMILYTLVFKRTMILDCIIISVGFCLRAVAGAVVVGVFISPWLIICTFTLCLFLAFSKRRGEIVQLEENSELFRRTLAAYTPELLVHMIDVTSGLAVISFLLYAMDDRTLEAFGTNNLVYTTPFVLYCVFRFSALIQKGRYSGPVQLISRDIPFQIGFILWVLCCICIIYANQRGITFGNIWAY